MCFFLGLQSTNYDENSRMNVNVNVKKGYTSPKKDNMSILHYSDTQCTAVLYIRLFTSDGSQNEKSWKIDNMFQSFR